MSTDYQDHKSEAERLLAAASDSTSDSGYQNFISAAQVHATLALAEATRANGTVTVREDRP